MASLGLGVLTGDVYKKVLAVVIERDLGPDSVTNQFVLELKSYVAEQSRGGERSGEFAPRQNDNQASLSLTNIL